MNEPREEQGIVGDRSQGAAEEAPKVQPWTVYLLLAIIAGGFVVGWNLLTKIGEENIEALASGRLPVIARLEDNIVLLNDKAERVELAQLQGKVWIAAYLYSDCPSGCAGVAVEMEEIRQTFADEPDFHVVSFSLDPELDPPAKLAAFRETNGFDAENWWFLTDDTGKLPGYMTRTFKFGKPRRKPESEQLSPNDIYEHDMSVRLVDRDGSVRGSFAINHLDQPSAELYQERLREGIRRLLDGDDGR